MHMATSGLEGVGENVARCTVAGFIQDIKFDWGLAKQFVERSCPWHCQR
jgi:hypothetical protein